MAVHDSVLGPGNRQHNTNHHSRLGFKENVPKLIKADVLIPVYIRLLNHLLDFLISEDQADTETIYVILYFNASILSLLILPFEDKLYL